MTLFAQVEIATGRVAHQVEESAAPPDHDGFTYHACPGLLDWRAQPSPTAVLYWNDGAPAWEDPSLSVARETAWEQVKAARAAAELSPFEFDGGLYDADTPRISGAALNALMAQLAGVPFSIDWTLADNTVRTLDGGQMQALGVALAQHVGTAFAIARAKRDAIAAAQSPAAAYEAAAWPQS